MCRYTALLDCVRTVSVHTTYPGYDMLDQHLHVLVLVDHLVGTGEARWTLLFATVNDSQHTDL